MLKKVKEIALGTRMAVGVIGTRMAVGVINRRQVINIATGMVRANNPNLLKEYGGDIMLTENWLEEC